ncbi:MAG: amidohydrolase family protein, partial [Gemmataceae bacterium]
ERDINLDPLVEALEKKRTVHFHCHRADDIMTAVRLSREFGFELVCQHCTEGYRVADELARLGIFASLTLVDSPGGKPEVMGLLEENAAILAKAGVKVAVNTDDPVTESRFFLRSGAIAMRGGMTEDQALKALTLHPTEMLGLEDQCGSLAKGKDADFVILSGAPFSVYTHVLETYIEGEKVFDRSIQRDWTYQAGGFALPRPERLPEKTALMKPAPKVEAPPIPKDSPRWKEGDKKLAVLAGRIHTVSGAPIQDGVILVEDGKIKAVGPAAKVKIPDGFPVVTAAEVTPGFIDAHSVVGLSGPLGYPKADQDQDELSDPNQADLRVLDSFHPDDTLLQFIREQGVTVVHAVPGRANVIAGQSGIFRTFGRTADEMAIRFPAALVFNLGEVPKSTYKGKAPSTRMATANLLRTQLAQAEIYLKKKAATKDTPINLKYEALDLVLPPFSAHMMSRKLPVIFSAHRSDDIATALRIADEFKLKPILSFATEGYLLPDEIAKAKVPVILHPGMQRCGSMETLNTHLGNGAFLSKKGILLAQGTGFEGYVPKTRVLRCEAAITMINGLGFDKTLKSVTQDAAKLLAIDDKYGSIDVGKEADLVLWDGDPFEHRTHALFTISAGRIVYDRAETLKLPFARRALPLLGGDFGCCMGAW